MRVRRLLCLVFAGSALAYACSSFDSEPIDPSVEAGTEGGGGDGGDGSPDLPPDGALPIDASDGGPDTGVLFFDDFDDGGRSSAWGVDFVDPAYPDAGDIVVEATGLSPPNALNVRSRSAPVGSGLLWSWPAAGNKTRLSMSLDVRVVSRPTSNAFIVVNVIDDDTAHNKDNSPAPMLVISPDAVDATIVRFAAFNLPSSDATMVGQVLGSAPLDTWQHVEMGYEAEPGDPLQWKVTWSVGSSPVFTKTVPAPPQITPGRSTFIGIRSGTAIANVRFDNVKIDLR